MNELDLCREEGFRQFIKNGGRHYVNPYLSGTDEYKQFKAGWRQAAFICGHRGKEGEADGSAAAKPKQG